MGPDRQGFVPPRPAYFLLPVLEPRRSPPPDREAGLWGELTIEAECLIEIHVGGTAPDVVDLDRGPALIEGMTSLPGEDGPVPVVPGSSVKGAVRAVVEAITPSCERVGGRGCVGKELCPACAALGAPGWRSTIAFSDLIPADPDVELEGVWVAQRYSHSHAPRRGRRLYGLVPEEPLPDETEALACLRKGTVLTGAVRFEGASERAAGLVTFALGLPPRGLPLLRLGAAKNRGLAQARLRLTGGHVALGWAGLVRGETRPVDTAIVEAWQETALTAWPETQERIERIAVHYSAGDVAQ